ncbi:MAG: transglutaminase domain-containing protein [Clostridium sp.]
MDKRKEKKRFFLKTNILILILIGMTLLISIQVSKKIKKELTMEVSAIVQEDFSNTNGNKSILISDINNIDVNEDVTLDNKDKISIFKTISKLFKKDKIPPKLILKPVIMYSYENINIEDFIEIVEDESEWTISYSIPPNLDIVGEQEITIEAKDSSENITVEKTTLTIKKDITPPVITGVLEKFIYLGDTISYKQDVIAIDEVDGEVEVNVDNSKVDLKKVGVYEVIYTAKDKSENTSNVIMNLNIIEKVAGANYIYEVNKLADEVLASIIKKDMTKIEQARAIFYWVKNNISYSKNSKKESWITGAYEGFKYRKGDCYIYFATSKALLTRAGIENINVKEINGRHYWNMINCGDGWYHFDATVFMEPVDVFMWTDAQADNLYITGRKLHTWDKATVPESGK